MDRESVDSSVEVFPRSYLGRWVDNALVLPDDLSVEAIEEEEHQRLVHAIAVVVYASTIPRRLGGEADGDDLALDKRRCRRVAHALKQAHSEWRKTLRELPQTDDVRMEGAQLVWGDFQAEHLTKLEARARLSATYAARTLDVTVMRWGKTAVTHYENERRWLLYALRD